jgi:hypothetical protein
MKRFSNQQSAALEFCMSKLPGIALAAAVAVALMLPAGLRGRSGTECRVASSGSSAKFQLGGAGAQSIAAN